MVTITSPLESLGMLIPEIIVVLTGALILIADLIWLRPKDAPPSARAPLAYFGIAGLVLAILATIAERDAHATLFEGIIVIDPLSAYFKVLFLGIAIVVLLLSVDPLPKISRWAAEFYALIIWCTLGHMLLASAAELFTIFMSLQLTSLPLIVLIGYAKRDPRSGEASLKYLLLVLVSTAVLLYGMTLIYGGLGTSTIAEIGAKLAAGTPVHPGHRARARAAAHRLRVQDHRGAVPVLGAGRLHGRTHAGHRRFSRWARSSPASHSRCASSSPGSRSRSTGTSSSASWRRCR